MKVMAPALLPILRSQAQGDILAWVFLTPGAHSIAEIARATGVPEITVLREINRLVATGFVTERRRGRARLIEPNPQNPAMQPLTALLAVTFGPAFVLRELLRDREDVEYAAIYGSWAARAAGGEGPPPTDIDLLIVGAISQRDAYDLAEEAAVKLRRPVNATVLDPATWSSETDPFVLTVRQRPLVALVDQAKEGTDRNVHHPLGTRPSNDRSADR